MTLFRSLLFAAVCLAVLFTPSASAQTQPFTIQTYTGNGQMICSGCPNARYQIFEPLTVQVLDATGAPVSGQTITWSLHSGNGNLSTASSVTDSNGLSSNTYNVMTVAGSPTLPYITHEISASVGTGTNQTAMFYETQVLANQNGTYAAQVNISTPTSVTGTAGSTAAAITYAVQTNSYTQAYGYGIPGVELRILNGQANPSMKCATGSGPDAGTSADPGTVLTDATGAGTCNPILSGSGNGTFQIEIGGVAVSTYAEFTGLPISWYLSGNISLSVTAATAGSLQIISGNGQTQTAGQQLLNPLVATVRDTNNNLLTAQAVTWSASPSSAGTFNTGTTYSSDSNGKVQAVFTFASTASGNVTISVSLPNSSVRQSFTVTAIPLVTVTSLVKTSGDNQTAVSGQAFSQPLIVQVTNSNGQVASGTTINFTASGPIVLSTNTPTTNNANQAQVTVTAGTVATQTAATVTASVGSLYQTFNLTVMPPGPSISGSSFVNAADQKVGSLSPCSLATVVGSGLAPSISGTLVGAAFGPGPLTLGGDAIMVSGTAAPIFSMSNSNGTQSITFQVPCEVTPSAAVPVVVTVGGGTATVNTPILTASPGVYSAMGTDGTTRAILVRQDGSFVSLSNPARRGETVTAFVTGLGSTSPSVSTNQLPPRGAVSTVMGTVVPGIAGSGATLVSAQLTTDLVGVYQVSFTIPSTANTGNNIGFSIGLIPVGASTAQYSNLVYVPVQ